MLDKDKRTQEIMGFDAKLADIVNMAGFPMAIIEDVKGEEMVYCTKNVTEFFGVELLGWKDNYVSRQTLINMLEPCKETLYPEYNEPDVFRYVLADNSRRWFSIKAKENENRTLYVLMEVTESIRERRKMRRDRDFDALTGLYTRRALHRKMESLLGERNVKKGILSVWDLDNLKYVNDHYGHGMGDKYLCAIADIFRAIQTKDKIASRLGGDEYVLVLHSEEPEILIEKLREIHRSFCEKLLELPDGTNMHVSASVGVAVFSLGDNNYEELFRIADDAMYDMKKQSKGGIKIVTTD